MAEKTIMKEDDFIFAERPKNAEDRLRFLKALLVDWEAIEVEGDGVDGEGFWDGYLNGTEGREIEYRLASFLHENAACAEYYLRCCKEHDMDFPYTAKLTMEALRTVDKEHVIQFAVLPENEPTTCFNGDFRVTSVGGIPETDYMFIFTEDKKSGNPNAYATDFEFCKEDRITTKNIDAYSILDGFGFDVDLDVKFKVHVDNE